MKLKVGGTLNAFLFPANTLNLDYPDCKAGQHSVMQLFLGSRADLWEMEGLQIRLVARQYVPD